MPLPRLLLLSRQGSASLPPEILARLNRVADVQAHRCEQAPTGDDLIRLLAGVDLLGATNRCLPRIDAELLDSAPGLRGVVLYATGYDHIDVDLLRRRGVGLSVVGDYATQAVAEHTLALMFALATRLHLSNDRCRGLAAPTVSLRGIELAGRTLGVVGTGRIGLSVARMARALRMTVAATDCDPAAVDRARRAGFMTCGLDQLLRSADVVALCASHTYGSPALVGARELALMRSGALLVNASRSALVDTPAVTDALRTRHLRGYAVDDQLPDAHGLTDLVEEGRLLQTGHSAWWRDEVLTRGAAQWGHRLIGAALGTPEDIITWPAAETAQPVAA